MIGALLNNRYRLDAELGQGGMGRVYRARDTLLERDVAVKILNDARLGTSGRARLLREAQAVAQLNHPNIVSVYDAGEAGAEEGTGNSSNPFIVMELVDGHSLHERPPQSLSDILSIARQICAALDHAHAHGIVHRDLKPENVLIASDGVVKLMDFGLARTGSGNGLARRTTEGGIVGTVFYLAPEQALGQPIDGRADLYALGVMLYELTTGHLPFSGDDPLTVIAQHIHVPVAPLRSIQPDLPQTLEAIILKLLAKDPADRFASAREVAAALTELDRPSAPTTTAPDASAQRNNLPIQLTSFVGREKEIAEIKRLLADRRLLTITGSGGTGKTRLALQVAADLLPAFSAGVWLVELASLSDPELVPQTVATVLGVREEPAYPLTKVLVDYLRPKSLLLIVDNCEHLIQACAELAEALLRACPNVKIIASSREALGIPGETALRVPSLSMPDIADGIRRHLPSIEELSRYESVRLFVERAVIVKPEFQLTEANAAAIAQICHRLDGVPLAIELAAARVRTMTAEQIAARLDDRFRLLTGGSRTALPRQQTLRALIDWSWDLLSAAERALFRRLSVFLDGWTLEAAEAVCVDDDAAARSITSGDVASGRVDKDEVLALLTHLVEKSLVLVEERGVETRYSLLETIRQYARDKLFDAGASEAESVRSRHLNFYLQLSEEVEPKLRGGEQLAWLARLEAEHDNLRAALKWALGCDEIEAGLRLAGNLSRFWYLRGYWNEGRDWLRLMLAESTSGESLSQPLSEQPLSEQPLSESMARARIKALCGAAWLADEDGREIPMYTESLELCRRIRDRWGEAYSLRGLVAGESNWSQSEYVQAQLETSLNLFRDLCDAWGIGLALYSLGWLALNRSENAKAKAVWEESLHHFRRSGDRWGIAVTLNAYGYAERILGNYAHAMSLTEEGLALFRELGDKAGVATSLSRLGNVAMRRGDYEEAQALLEQSVAIRKERGDQKGTLNSLGLLGLVACYQGEYSRATEILQQGLTLAQESGDDSLASYSRACLAWVLYAQNDLRGAAALWQGTLDEQRQIEDKEVLAFSHYGLGLVALREGDHALAAERLENSLSMYQIIDDKRYIAAAHHSLAQLAYARGDAACAATHFTQSLDLRKTMGDKQGIAETLEGLASLMSPRQHVEGTVEQAEQAARLFGMAQALRETIGAPVPPVERAEVDRRVATLRARLGEDGFSTALADGTAMKMEQASELLSHLRQWTHTDQSV